MDNLAKVSSMRKGEIRSAQFSHMHPGACHRLLRPGGRYRLFFDGRETMQGAAAHDAPQAVSPIERREEAVLDDEVEYRRHFLWRQRHAVPDPF